MKLSVTHDVGGVGRTLVAVGLADADWSAEGATRLTWSEGNVWSVELALPTGHYEYKLAVLGDDDSLTWESGPNRAMEIVAAEAGVEADPEAELAAEWRTEDVEAPSHSFPCQSVTSPEHVEAEVEGATTATEPVAATTTEPVAATTTEPAAAEDHKVEEEEAAVVDEVAPAAPEAAPEAAGDDAAAPFSPPRTVDDKPKVAASVASSVPVSSPPAKVAPPAAQPGPPPQSCCIVM